MTILVADRSSTATTGDHGVEASGAIRLWRTMTAARVALSEALDADGASCPVIGSDALEVLLPLAEAPGMQLRMAELAARSHLSPSGLTRRVDRLEAGGLVRRVHCPDDRRGAYAQLTDAGLRALGRALPHHSAALERLVGSRLDEEAIDDLEELLGRLAGRGATADTTPRD